jgi:hypothetical protein
VADWLMPMLLLIIGIICYVYRAYLELHYDMLVMFGPPSLWSMFVWPIMCIPSFLLSGVSAMIAGGRDTGIGDDKGSSVRVKVSDVEMQPIGRDQDNYMLMVDDNSGSSSGNSNVDANVNAPASRFSGSTRELIVGRPEAAAFGLSEYLSITNQEHAHFLGEEERAIELEFMNNPLAANLYAKYPDAKARDRSNYDYVANKAAEHKMVTGNAGVEEEQDVGHDGWLIHDFVDHATAKQAQLLLVHVLALRLYTSSSYESLNLPLRDAGSEWVVYWYMLLPYVCWYVLIFCVCVILWPCPLSLRPPCPPRLLWPLR